MCRFNCINVKTKILAEAANGPTTFAAQQYFDSKNIPVIPDFVLNAGGVTVSYFEWLKNLEHSTLGRLTKRWESKANEALMKACGIDPTNGGQLKEGPSEKQIVCSALQEAMSSAINGVFEKSLEMKTSLRVAGYVVAIQRIAQCYEDTDIF
jgi:glutamate dehydrogenase (NAD(P)+)